MTTHTIGLYFHYLGLVGLFVGYGLEWTGSSLLRRATSTEQARTALGIYRLSMPISGPGLLVLILSGGYYRCPVDRASRSLMNVVFRVAGGDEAVEKKFAKGAAAADTTGVRS